MVTIPEKNAALVWGFLIDVVTSDDTEAVGTDLANDVVDHNLVFGEKRVQRPIMILGWRVLAAADIDIDVEDVVATEDTVAVRGPVAGTHQESLLDLAPTGASFEITFAWFCRIDGGRIAEIWLLPDGLGLTQQLGVIPEVSLNLSLTHSTEHK